MSIYIPYTYLIGWSAHNKWYYGVQTRKNCNPNHLWTKYFTSSNIVKAFRKLYGEPDIIQIRKTFTSKELALKWEIGVLCRLKVNLSDNWLNQRVVYMDGSIASKNWMSTDAGKKLLKDSRKKWKENNPDYRSWNAGITKDDHIALQAASVRAKEHQATGQIPCIGDQMRGKEFTDNHREKLKVAALNREPMVWVSNDETKTSTKIVIHKLEHYMSLGWKRGRVYNFKSPFLDQKLDPLSNPHIIQSTCEHCGKVGQRRSMLKYHHSRCKLNLSS